MRLTDRGALINHVNGDRCFILAVKLKIRVRKILKRSQMVESEGATCRFIGPTSVELDGRGARQRGDGDALRRVLHDDGPSQTCPQYMYRVFLN